MKKHFFFVPMFALAMGTMFTACNDDSDLVNQPSTETTAQTGQSQDDGSFVSIAPIQNKQVAVRFDGNKAAVTTDVQSIVGAQLNADVTFTNSYSGYLTMNDSQFSKKQIPFIKSTTILTLDFSESSDFGGNTVALKKGGVPQMDTRALVVDGKFCSEDVIDADGQQAVTKLTQGLLKFGAKAVFGDFGAAMADPVLSLVFGSSDPNVAKFKQIEDDLAKMDQHISNVEAKIDQKDAAEAYRQHWIEINTLRTAIGQVYELLQSHPEQKDCILNDFANENISGNTVKIYIPTLIQKYTNIYDHDKTWDDILDEFAFDAYPFEDLGYNDRELTRFVDLETFSEAAYLMHAYYESAGLTESASKLEDILDSYYQYADAHQVKHDDDHVICQIPGAYLIMQKQAIHKVVGKGVYKEDNPNRGYCLNPHAHDEEERDKGDGNHGSWINSYVFSDQGIGARKQEIKAMCLTKDQAQAIVDYYQQRGQDKTLYQILSDEGVKGFTAQKGQILLADNCMADWDHYQAALFKDTSHAHINASVWDNETNKYNGCYRIDDVTFINHNNTDWFDIYVTYEFGDHEPDLHLDYVVVEQSWSERDKAVVKQGYVDPAHTQVSSKTDVNGLAGKMILRDNVDAFKRLTLK